MGDQARTLCCRRFFSSQHYLFAAKAEGDVGVRKHNLFLLKQGGKCGSEMWEKRLWTLNSSDKRLSEVQKVVGGRLGRFCSTWWSKVELVDFHSFLHKRSPFFLLLVRGEC